MKKLIILILLLTGQNLYSQDLKLTHPKGGEKFLIGSDTLITWEGIPETEPIKIELSNDNGLTWQTLTNSATGLKYNWTNIPSPQSDECIIRIKQTKVPGIEWEKSFGGSREDEGISIQQTFDGGYVVAGNSISYDRDVSENNGSNDYWIIKLSPSGEVEWERSYGGSRNDYANSIQQTFDGGYIVVGYTISSDGDVSEPKGLWDYWIIKLKADGSLEWERSYGGSGIDIANSIQQTYDGGFIVAGDAENWGGDVRSTTKGGKDFWILKLRTNGEIEWERCYGGRKYESATSIEQTTEGGYIVAGWSESNNGDIDDGRGNYDFWILKLSSNGEIEWEQNYGGSEYDYANAVMQTKEGGYIVAGRIVSSDFDVSKNNGHHDYWILKLNTKGELVWEKSFGGNDWDVAKSILQSSDGDYIIAGYSRSTNIEDNKGNYDAWIIKLSPSGESKWEKSFGGRAIDWANSIQQTYDGGYVFAGASYSYYGDVSENLGKNDFWIVKLSSDGEFEWEKRIGGTNNEEAHCIQQTYDGGYIVAGYSESNDGDVSENKGSYDYWIAKLYPEAEPVNQTDSSGLFSIAMPPEDARLLDNSGIHSITPNPADNEIKIVVTIKEVGHTEIVLYNIVGQKVNEIFSGEVSEIGVHEFTGYISNLAIGYYFLVFQTPTIREIKNLVIVR